MEVSLQRYDEKFGGWLDFVTFLVIAAQGAPVESPLNFNVDVCVAAAVFLLQCVLRASEDNATGADGKPRTAVTSPRVAPRNAFLHRYSHELAHNLCVTSKRKYFTTYGLVHYDVTKSGLVPYSNILDHKAFT